MSITTYAIDPGEKRTGIAIWIPVDKVICHTLPPWQAVDFLDRILYEDCEVVMENWVPYPDTPSNNYRDLIEAKILGAIEHVCRKRNIPYCYQPTTILIPTTALADSRGYRWSSTNRDEKAAETHLYYHRHLKGKRP